MKHRLLLPFLTAFFGLLTASAADAQTAPSPDAAFALKAGDILFQALPCGGLCDAIIATTPCEGGKRFNHCGIVRTSGGRTTVIEAIGSQVQETPLQQFLARDSSGLMAVGRVRSLDEAGAKAGAERALQYLGRPYDDAFLPGDTALYCSELVWESLREPGSGKPVFSLRPMTFKPAPGSPAHPAWMQYYKQLGVAIPEGEPGINPCAIAASPLVEFRWVAKPAGAR